MILAFRAYAPSSQESVREREDCYNSEGLDANETSLRSWLSSASLAPNQ